LQKAAPWIYEARFSNLEAGNLGGTLNTGLTTLKLKRPLSAAVYEEMLSTATGNGC